MSWAAIAESDVITHISSAEIEGLRSAALADGQTDPVAPAISQVTSLVRGYVAACRRNELDADTTKIPTRLLGAACDMVVAEIIGRVPGYDLDEIRQGKYDKALKLMDRVADCKFSIEDPDTGEDQVGSIEVGNSTTRVATRTQMQGL